MLFHGIIGPFKLRVVMLAFLSQGNLVSRLLHLSTFIGNFSTTTPIYLSSLIPDLVLVEEEVLFGIFHFVLVLVLKMRETHEIRN